MTKFEEFLMQKGYRKYFVKHPEKKYELEKEGRHSLSTVGNLCYSYFHKDDAVAMEKIEAGISVGDFTRDDIKGEIVFGLSEFGKPPTLISQRPKIRVFKKQGENIITQYETDDDAMNIVLEQIPNEIIFEAIYNSNIVFIFNLTGIIL